MRTAVFAGCAAVLLAGLPAAADRLPDRADPVVDYRIDVRLDAVNKQLIGRERLVWKNPSSDAVGDLWFHLYLNAFKNSRSTFMRESGGRLRSDRMTRDSWGWIDVTSMRLVDGRDLRSAATFEHPDDDNADDQTVLRVPLPEPVRPGGSIALEIEFRAQLPEVFARTGYKRNFFMVGQWFPKVAVYEPAGTRGRSAGGWNCHQFHATSEFYADFGAYRVAITTPKGFIVGATGPRVSTTEHADGTVTVVHQQDNVHDFAWTADPEYVELRRTFSASRDVSPQEYEQASRLLGRTLDEVRLSDVEIILLIHKPRLAQAERHFRAAKDGLKWFGLWYGRYPYKTLTVVDPAFGAGGAGGMEYPTLITAGTSALLNRWPLDGVRAAEEVTVHEFGHQYWYGLVANNEFEEAWLDEGLNSYSSGKVMQRAHGAEASMISIPWLKLSGLELVRAQNSPDRKSDPILTPAWKFESTGAYGFASYAKSELVLRTLEGYLGEQTMARLMRTYHERWRYRHPRSEDFFAVANEVSGRDLTWYFDQTVGGTGVLDYAIASVTSAQRAEPIGTFDGKAGKHTVKMDDARRRERERTDRPYESTVVVQRKGEIVFPVEIALRYEGGRTDRRRWDGRDRWLKIRTTSPERLSSADVDPDRRVLLDVDWLNNARRVESDRRAATKWSSRLMFWVQNLVATMVGF
ncbi:MAG TPA: M1 family metallopeptidase [Vicinamibacterales bacterium]|nr:M1 family metallopeptidase [Vicinamibacterales bacterium]